MPLDLGVSALLADEYDRFIAGLDGLSDGGQRMARARAARMRPEDTATRNVIIPGWSDIFHVTPAPQVTPAMREAHYAAIRAGRPSPLAPALQQRIEERARRARVMNADAAPDYARAYGQVMTAIDNVQDLMTTIVTLGRLALIPAMRALDFLGPVMTETAARIAAERAATAVAVAAAAEGVAMTPLALAEAQGAARAAASAAFRAGAFGFGARTLGRAIPILGLVLLGSDLLKLLTQLGLLAFPGYAFLCAGATHALAAGVPAAIMGRALKLRAGGMAALNPFSRRARLTRSRTLREWRPSIYNMMEVAQTTDALFGVGVSFGGIVGLIQGAAFGAEQRARGQDVRVVAPGFSERMRSIYQRMLGPTPTPALHDLRTSAAVLGAAPAINGTQDDFTAEEHIDALIAQAAAWDILRPWIEAPETVDAVNLALDLDWPPPEYLADETAAWMADAGLPAPGFGTWPLPGNPATVRGETLLVETAPRVTGALRRLLEPRRDEIEAPFIGALVDRITSHGCYQLAGALDAWEYELDPVYQVLESLAMAWRWPSIGEGEAAVGDFFARCAEEMARQGRRSLGPADLQALADQAGITLIKALPPGAPYPESFFQRSPALDSSV